MKIRIRRIAQKYERKNLKNSTLLLRAEIFKLCWAMQRLHIFILKFPDL